MNIEKLDQSSEIDMRFYFDEKFPFFIDQWFNRIESFPEIREFFADKFMEMVTKNFVPVRVTTDGAVNEVFVIDYTSLGIDLALAAFYYNENRDED